MGMEIEPKKYVSKNVIANNPAGFQINNEKYNKEKDPNQMRNPNAFDYMPSKRDNYNNNYYVSPKNEPMKANCQMLDRRNSKADENRPNMFDRKKNAVSPSVHQPNIQPLPNNSKQFIYNKTLKKLFSMLNCYLFHLHSVRKKQ